MKHVQIDFVQVYGRSRWVGWLVLLVGVMLAAMPLYYQTNVLAPQSDALESQLEMQARVLHPAAPASRWKSEEIQALARTASQVSAELNIPWQDLFQFMDQESGKDLALLALEPDTTKGMLSVTAEARDFGAMLKFYEAMQASRLFRNVVLQSHAINQNVPEQPVRFRVRAQWVMKE